MTSDVEPLAREETQSRRFTIAEALELAMKLHREGRLDQAEAIYRRILEAAPDHPDALHFFGVLSHQRGRSDEAIALIGRSIELQPDEPAPICNLGNVLVDRGRAEEAAEAYRRAIALDPDHVAAHNNLGALLKSLGRFDDAEASYRRAIALSPADPDFRNNLGHLLGAQGRGEEALACYCEAIALAPRSRETRRLLGMAYYANGQIDKASEVFREWVEEEPDDPTAQHMYAACSGENVPARAGDLYIAKTFDSFANSFDAKLGQLGYQAPQLVAHALARACGAPEKRLDCLDAGCGTGLCGPLIAPYVRRLVGVDLSSGMLERARSREIYDELVRAELTAFLDAQAAAYDVVISADTFVYFGALDGVLKAAARALRADGLLLFTVEEASGAGAAGHRINPHGRYSHERAYVARAVEEAGFAVAALEPAVLRQEAAKPVHGLVVTARKRAAA
jgi:predicted TPR repeat methyltransferase